jgi:hypothetical protein
LIATFPIELAGNPRDPGSWTGQRCSNSLEQAFRWLRETSLCLGNRGRGLSRRDSDAVKETVAAPHQQYAWANSAVRLVSIRLGFAVTDNSAEWCGREDLNLHTLTGTQNQCEDWSPDTHCARFILRTSVDMLPRVQKVPPEDLMENWSARRPDGCGQWCGGNHG